MSKSTPSSNELIDDLVVTYFNVTPEVMASLAHGDAETDLGRLATEPPTVDPLDGLTVFVRRVLATAIAMRAHPGAIHLVTERQARRAGWPSAHMANLCIALAWGMLVEFTPTRALPVLLEADETAPDTASDYIRVDRRLPPLDTLEQEFFSDNLIDPDAMDRAAETREHAPQTMGRKPVNVWRFLKEWLGVDADEVLLRSDRNGRRVHNGNARAVLFLPIVMIEALEIGRTLREEAITAVRIKTEQDALIAQAAPAAICNLSLLLGAAINHAGGYTVHVLPPNEAYAAALAAAYERIAAEHGRGDGAERAAWFFDLQDLSARGFVHVGRRAALGVARRLYDHVVEATSVTA